MNAAGGREAGAVWRRSTSCRLLSTTPRRRYCSCYCRVMTWQPVLRAHHRRRPTPSRPHHCRGARAVSRVVCRRRSHTRTDNRTTRVVTTSSRWRRSVCRRDDAGFSRSLRAPAVTSHTATTLFTAAGLVARATSTTRRYTNFDKAKSLHKQKLK